MNIPEITHCGGAFFIDGKQYSAPMRVRVLARRNSTVLVEVLKTGNWAILKNSGLLVDIRVVNLRLVKCTVYEVKSHYGEKP